MEEKISVIIPNYNGRELLAKNLPKVLENCPGCEVIVVDDASNDDSVAYIKKNYKRVKLLVNSKNAGFAKTVNCGVEKATGQYVLLLNSDVAPQKGFLQSAMESFSKESQKTFAVGLSDFSHEEGKIIVRGRGGAKFIRGFINHYALPPKSGETLWVSGGSSLIDRQKFLELGGFDSIFAPFYWEDIDLSYRARKKGYLCFFDENSKVDHFHQEGAIKKSSSGFRIKSISYKNQFLFVWKNIEDYWWITLHLLWLPYHFARALINRDFAFFTGFLWALTKIPQLVLSSNFEVHSSLSDREVLKKFEKQ
ncbi:MAG: glycosyltransferase family 2 protein [Candidatus Curtissbacteria bacterium]|nr:glycosyltransferase family 2 protein [Candidatus Curtissbacteria bacterium]